MNPNTSTAKSLREMDEKDVYSVMLFALYKLSDDPKYSTISELIYLIDKESLLKFLSVFEGVTIKVPKLSELRTLVAGLEIYNRVNLGGEEFSVVLKDVKTPDIFESEIKEAYLSICKVLENYDFGRGQ